MKLPLASRLPVRVYHNYQTLSQSKVLNVHKAKPLAEIAEKEGQSAAPRGWGRVPGVPAPEERLFRWESYLYDTKLAEQCLSSIRLFKALRCS